MSIFAIIANIINKILSFSLFPSLPATGERTTGEKTEPSPVEQHGNRCNITIPESINPTARFFSTGSPAWTNQHFVIDGKDYYGIHGGTDFVAPQGSAVYAPFDMDIIAIGHYSDSGRYGDYVIATLKTGEEYYSGHLQNVAVTSGQAVKCGDKLGETNLYAHTHIQIKRAGQVIDPESIL